MGYSFGAGIGMTFGRANTSRSDGRTVVIARDGAFFMHGMEVHTAVQYRLPGDVRAVQQQRRAGLATAVRTALEIDGPAVISVECAADELPTVRALSHQEDRIQCHVTAFDH